MAASASEQNHLRRLWARLGIPADYLHRRGLRPQRAPRRLVRIGRSPAGRLIRLTLPAAAAWKRMQCAAGRDGIVLLPISGFRSVAKQTALIRAKLRRGENLRSILRVLTAPGYSEHHTGRALDVGCPGSKELTTGFGRSRAFRWLEKNASRFGFRLSYPRGNSHGISYEPWHWFYVTRRQRASA